MAYGLYLGRVVGTSIMSSDTDAHNDARIQIKITPQMDSIPDEDAPMYPCFFRDEGFSGNVGDLVWVVSDDSFSVGYVLGLANMFTYSSMGGTISEDGQNIGLFERFSLSKNLCKALSDTMHKQKNQSYDLNNIKITYWDNNCIHFVERFTGGSIIAYSNGNMLVMRPDEFFVLIGESKIALNSNGISLAASSVKVQSKDIELGLNPSGAVNITAGTNGSNATTSEYVRA